ncbi:Rv3654c family TadE-like protein [Corynebacterium pelargi]|uniref:Putative Flp pilus-assembly TadG-like N-terminal domain-containing protein n=1 Tax=Corynebacterium pelargi TaxID=1471400 RepID=A0A410WBG9_9CORY|nr:Rv3654c family TadE-like protein [Corynebacterium pelargi]QAU53286.1 hypothetical protein CPELA_10180 [Corynebacterium pelargi]GGG73545.1 hypothetical protein GCM10007338_08500 [Corynebacterium pelargi]
MNKQLNLRNDRGSATVLALGIAMALSLILGIMLAIANAHVQAHRAQVAADMGAIAAAQARAYGQWACPKAKEVINANGASMTLCIEEDQDVRVSAQVGRQVAQAKAGPI